MDVGQVIAQELGIHVKSSSSKYFQELDRIQRKGIELDKKVLKKPLHTEFALSKRREGNSINLRSIRWNPYRMRSICFAYNDRWDAVGDWLKVFYRFVESQKPELQPVVYDYSGVTRKKWYNTPISSWNMPLREENGLRSVEEELYLLSLFMEEKRYDKAEEAVFFILTEKETDRILKDEKASSLLRNILEHSYDKGIHVFLFIPSLMNIPRVLMWAKTIVAWGDENVDILKKARLDGKIQTAKPVYHQTVGILDVMGFDKYYYIADRKASFDEDVKKYSETIIEEREKYREFLESL